MSNYSSYQIKNQSKTTNFICFASLINNQLESKIIIEKDKLSFNENINKDDLEFLVDWLTSLGCKIVLEKEDNEYGDYYIHFKASEDIFIKRFICTILRTLYEGYNNPMKDCFYHIYLNFKKLYELLPNEDIFELYCIANNITFANNTQGLKLTSFTVNTNHTLGIPYVNIINTETLKKDFLFNKNRNGVFLNTNFGNKNILNKNYVLKDVSDESYLEIFNKNKLYNERHIDSNDVCSNFVTSSSRSIPVMDISEV